MALFSGIYLATGSTGFFQQVFIFFIFLFLAFLLLLPVITAKVRRLHVQNLSPPSAYNSKRRNMCFLIFRVCRWTKTKKNCFLSLPIWIEIFEACSGADEIRLERQEWDETFFKKLTINLDLIDPTKKGSTNVYSSKLILLPRRWLRDFESSFVGTAEREKWYETKAVQSTIYGEGT